MNIVLSIILPIIYVSAALIGTVLFWFCLMWLVSRSERKPIKKHRTPEEIEAFVEMSKRERRRIAKERLKLHRQSKKIPRWMRDKEAERWLDENPDKEIA